MTTNGVIRWPMINVVLDTCVWIRLSRLVSWRKHLEVIEVLRREGEIRFVVPQTVRDEFEVQWDKPFQDTILEMFGVEGVLTNLRGAADGGIAHALDIAIRHTRDSAMAGETWDGIARVRALLAQGDHVQVDDQVRHAALDRMLRGKAPFHKKKSAADVLVIEEFAAATRTCSAGDTFVFVTENRADFSSSSNKGEIHEDLRNIFPSENIRYYPAMISFMLDMNQPHYDALYADAIKRSELRRSSEVADRLRSVEEHLWYIDFIEEQRKIEAGDLKVLPDEARSKKWNPYIIAEKYWKAQEARAEAYRSANDIEFASDERQIGIIIGQVEALRWCLGCP